MRFRALPLAVSMIVAASFAAEAQPFQGFYVGAGAGYNMPVGIDVQPNIPGTLKSRVFPGGNVVGLGSVGYALGNGIRFELEGNYRQGDLNTVNSLLPQTASGRLRTYGAMANALFDMD